MKKQIFSIILAICMGLMFVPQETFAAGNTGTAPETVGKYATNPIGTGKRATITIDGSHSDWSEDMLIAQGAAWDVANRYKGAHDNSLTDCYSLYAAWDDDNLYIGWQMVNTTDTWARKDNGPLSDGGRIGDVPMMLALSIDPNSTGMTGRLTNGGKIWGSLDITFTTHTDALLLMSAKPGLGTPALFKAADAQGNTSYNPPYLKEFKDNGIQYAMEQGCLPTTLWMINGSPTTPEEEIYGGTANYVDALTHVFEGNKKHNTTYDSFYEIKIPFNVLGIDAVYLESNGIGVMQIATRGESAIDCLPHDPSMLDNAMDAYNSDPSTSHEKDDNDNITVPFAVVGGGEVPTISDTTAPVISGIENGKTYCFAKTVTVSDNDSIASVTVNGTPVSLLNNQFSLFPAKGTQKIVVKDQTGNRKEMIVTVNAGHTYGEWQSKGNGTHTRYCTVGGCNGYEDGNCKGGTATCRDKAICDYCKTEYGEVDSDNHNLEKIPAKNATVTETGNREYWHCKDCGKYFADENSTNEIALADTVTQKLPPETTEEMGHIPDTTDPTPETKYTWAKTVLRLQATASKTSIKLKWNEVPEADGYVIYWNKCGAKNGFKQVKVIESGKTLTWIHKNRKADTWNKYYVKAYKVIDGKRSFIKNSNRIHLVTKGGKYTNVKKLKSKVSDVTLNQGKTKALRITQTYAEKNKKPTLHMRPLTYTTSDKTVATVTSKGVIKAKGAGSCYIYITAHNGVYTRVKVTVK